VTRFWSPERRRTDAFLTDPAPAKEPPMDTARPPAVFFEQVNGHEHWTYQCPPPPHGCGYRTFAYSPTREAAEALYADHCTTHPIAICPPEESA
jgi:hypothetical protein